MTDKFWQVFWQKNQNPSINTVSTVSASFDTQRPTIFPQDIKTDGHSDTGLVVQKTTEDTAQSETPINNDSESIAKFRKIINSNPEFQFCTQEYKEQILKNLQDRHLLSYSDDLALGLAALSDEGWKKVFEQGLLDSKNPDDKIKLQETIMLDNHSGAEGISYLFTLDGNEYEHANEVLHGKMNPNIKEKLELFKQKHPDIEISVNNDVTEEQAEQIMQVSEEYVENHQNSGTYYAKKIKFGSMIPLGMCADKDQMWIRLKQDTNNMRTTLVHENGHARDVEDGGFSPKTIPSDVKPILNKMLREYATRYETNTEVISVLTEAIETPNDVDGNLLTKDLHVRKDENGNYLLMLPKEGCNVTKEELEKVGAFLRDVQCPAMVPDFDEAKHGALENYNQTIIRYKTDKNN